MVLTDADFEYDADQNNSNKTGKQGGNGTSDKVPNFTDEQHRFIIAKRLAMNDKFNNAKHKRQYWEDITRQLKEEWPGLPHTHIHVQKRYENSFTKYKKEKQEHSGTGTSPSTWPFFELFDEVLHYRTDVSLEHTHGRKRPFKETIRDIGRSTETNGLPTDEGCSFRIITTSGMDPTFEEEDREAQEALGETPTPEKKRRTDVRAQMLLKLDEHSEKSEDRITKLREALKEDREKRAEANAAVIDECKKNRQTSEKLMDKIDTWLKAGGFVTD